MTQTREGAGELSPYPSANEMSGGETALSLTILAPLHKRANHHPRPRSATFDPNLERTRCSVCGGRSGWRQWHSIGGAWAHCPPRALLEREHGAGDLDHQCDPSCLLGVAS